FLVYLHCRLLRDFRSHRYASTWVIRSAAMPVEVGEGFRVVVDHGVEVEGLRVGEVGVGDGSGNVRPIGAEPAAEAVGVIARAEVVVAGFGVAFFAGGNRPVPGRFAE